MLNLNFIFLIKEKLYLSLIFLICFGLSELNAQEAISASGGNASGVGGSASFTIGQIAYMVIEGTNGSMSEGVQQTLEIEIIDGIEEANNIKLICNAFPNPTTEFITLDIANYNNEDLSYQLFDINGNLIKNKQLNSDKINISMSKLITGIYFLKVIDGQKEIKTFQIIKK